MNKKETYDRAYSAIIDYLISFGVGRIHEAQYQDYPKTYGASVGFVVCDFGNSEPINGDLIRLESAPASKWRVSWLVDKRNKNGLDEYLCKSAKDGDLCWWSNVGVSHFHRKTLDSHPEWRWNDRQFAFNEKWLKSCKRHDPYIYRPLYADFRDDGSVAVGTRSRMDFDSKYPTVLIDNWKRATMKELEAAYLECVARHKES